MDSTDDVVLEISIRALDPAARIVGSGQPDEDGLPTIQSADVAAAERARQEGLKYVCGLCTVRKVGLRQTSLMTPLLAADARPKAVADMAERLAGEARKLLES